MYILPFLMVLLICLAIFFSPIFAVILAAFFLAGIGIYKLLSRDTDSEQTPQPEEAAAPAGIGRTSHQRR